jgi:DHA1 family tetracycline resistance protein-like MFS transporter
MKKPSLVILFLAVFMDLIGFGIVLPLLPLYSKEFGASGWLIGLIMASYSMMQFVCTPAWGRLSDRIGRRPVLLTSSLGAAISYVGFALGSGQSGPTALTVLLFSRVFAGIFGSSVTVAQAYIADVSPPEERSKKMGLVGMAFGLGFIFGPALGAFSAVKFGHSGPGWVAAALCATNFVLAFIYLPESRQPNSEQAPQRPHFAQWSHTLGKPKVGLTILLFFLATFCFTCFETTLGLLVDRNFHFDAKHVGYLFAYCGIVGAVVQGGAIGRMVKRFGESGLIAASLLMVAVSLAPLPFVTGMPLLLLVLGVLSIGSSLARPPIFGLISILTPAAEQGATLGVAQSAGSLARIFGPIFAGSLFEIQPSLPYLICGGISLVAGMIAWQKLHNVEQPPERSTGV